jgi:hypothetical protein
MQNLKFYMKDTMSKINVIRIILLTLLFISIGALGHAATIHVTTTEDKVAGSLREAITTANTNNENDTIYLPAGTYILTGEGKEENNYRGDLDISNDDRITIIGEGAATTIIDGNQDDRILHIHSGTVSISGVTFRNGNTNYPDANSGLGGGIYVCLNGQLTLTDCTVTDNSNGGSSGGGIHNRGVLTLTNCTVKNNNAGSGPILTDLEGLEGGGIYNSSQATAALANCVINNNTTGRGGGICNKGSMTLTNCTIYENKTGPGENGYGGGICNTGTLTVTHCTIKNNLTKHKAWQKLYGGNGGGIYTNNSNVYLKNTIVADNEVGTGGSGPDYYGQINSQGYNLIENSLGFTITGNTAGNILGQDPKLNNLANNGGTTKTCAFSPDSPAVDAGDSSGTSEDQRGIPRPQDFPGIANVSDGADIGAFELQSQYSISGTVTANGTGLAGVTLAFSDNDGTTTTDDQGNYSHTVSYGWSGTVTPSKEDYSFTPENMAYTDITSDQTDQDYTANPYSVSLSITSPQPGATVSGTVTISVNAASEMDSGAAFIQAITKVEFYIDDIPVHEDTTAPYQYSWDTTAYDNGTHTIKVKAYNAASQVQESQITVTVENEPPISHISLNRTYLNFGADTSGIETGSQDVLIANTGEGILEWTISDDADWLNCTPTSGTQSGMVTASIEPSGLQPGIYNGTVTIEAPYADNSPQTVAVTLTIYDGGSTQPPFGSFDTPIDHSTVMSSVPVTGWVLDDIQTEHVKIYREPLAGEGNNLVYIGEAIMVEGARTDIETASPDYPVNYKAGWGYMMLSNFLPNQGNGTFTLHAMASDKEGNTVTLGANTITCDNANAVKPFGAIDTPAQGGTASGSAYANFGWALTPLPNTIPTGGSTITVWVDGVALGNPAYNRYREDIATLFPGYNNSDGAVGLFYLDTTQYEDGVHTIAWTVEDDAGNSDGIGSRYFTVQNTQGARRIAHSAWRIAQSAACLEPVGIIKGYARGMEPQKAYPNEKNGVINIEINQSDRLEIHLDDLNSSSFIIHRNTASFYSGYLRVGRQLKPLPIGSTFDPGNGIFYWQPGPACIGNYEFTFITKTGTGDMKKKTFIIKIVPKEWTFDQKR